MDNEVTGAAESGLHPLVDLMLARMQSHPEEFFGSKSGRWRNAMDAIRSHGTAEEQAKVDHAMSRVALDHYHAQAMQELLDPQEDRNKAARALGLSHFDEAALARARQQMIAQKYSAQTATYPQGTYGSVGTSGPTLATLATAGTIGNGSIQLGSETVNEGLIKNIREALGL
jgi:hypothetical protein